MSQEILDQVRRRRTFAIISHPDAGKTTLTEKLLLFSGAIQSAGTVKGKKTGKFATSDWMEIEKQRGISVASSVMQFDYKDHTVNLLDTPGHQDFSEDTYRVLTAVDSALMVIDAAKGVEAQTIKLLNVCRLRNTPIVTFMNKYDREVRDSLELLDEVENILQIRCAPVTWPIGMGKNFKGVYHILNDEIYLFEAGGERLPHEFDIIKGIDNPELEQRFPLEIQQLRDEIELVQAASNEFNLDEFLAGELTPVFFGSAINNFGIQEILNSLIEWAPAPKPRDATVRMVEPDEPKFSGFIFKIQANMDPKHRDRIAFLRVCSGKFERGMKMKHLRINREIAASSVVTFHVARPRAGGRSLRRRHHRHPEPRQHPNRRQLLRRRTTGVHRYPILRARTVPQRPHQKPAENQATAKRFATARRRRRGTGLQTHERRRFDFGRGRRVAV